MPLEFVLDQSPLDSPFFAPGGDGTLALPGRDILVEMEALHISSGLETTLYFGSKGYNHPSAPDYYWPRLSQPLNFRRDIFSSQTTGGQSRTSFGEMRLINNDGGLDWLRDYAIEGRKLRMLIGDAGNGLSDPGWDYEDFVELVVCRVQRVMFAVDAQGSGNNSDSNAIVVQIRDRLEDFNKPLQVNKYAGTNVLPDGLEGAPTDDIKDQPKPLVIGLAVNFTPPCVNTDRLIYQGNDGAWDGGFVMDNGAFLALGTNYTDQADMEATAPAAGYYQQWLAGGMFRLGSTPTGTITCTGQDEPLLVSNTAAQVALRIATRAPGAGEGGVDSTDIEFDDIDVLDALQLAILGIWLNGGETYAQALDAVLGSVGAWYGFDRLGKLRIQRLDLPELPYVVTFKQASLSSPMAVGEFNIIAYRFMPSNDPDQGTPTYRVSLDYERNYTVQPPSVTAGVVLQSRRNFLALADRTEKAEDTDVQTTYSLAAEKTVKTLILDQDAAAAEAARLLAMFGTKRDFLEVDTVLRSDLIALVDIGSVVNIMLPRMGYDSGKIMRVIGMQYNAQTGFLTLACWG